MTSRKKQPSRGKPDVVKLPAALLRQSGLDIRGVPVRGGRVAFELPDDVLTAERLLPLLDIEYWNRLAVESRKAASARVASEQRDEAAVEKLVARIAESAGKRYPAAGKLLQRRIKAERQTLARMELPGSTPRGSARERRAVLEMRSIAIVQHQEKTYLLSTQRKKRPIVVAVVAAAGAVGVANAVGVSEFLFWGEVILEALMGIATIMGAKLNHNVKLGPWIEKLADLIKRNPRIAQKLSEMATSRGSLSAMALIDLFWALINVSGEVALDLILALCDISFVAGMYCLGKAITRFSPGWGQAILAAEIGVVVVELVAKIVRHFMPPPAESSDTTDPDAPPAEDEEDNQ